MKILVIRRDNIGDLVLTTPVFTALRQRFPGATIEALVNSYNAPVLAGHPDVDRVHVYTKAKHSNHARGVLPTLAARVRQWATLHERGFDYVLLAAPVFRQRQLRLARLMRPRHIAGFVDPETRATGIDLPVAREEPEARHHVEATFRILRALDIDGPPPPPRICVDAQAARHCASGPLVGVHVSSRKPRNRWPDSRYVELLNALGRRHGVRFRLFWAPGQEDDPRHPGDDLKAAEIIARTGDASVEARATPTLRDLVNGIADCDAFVCSDGGALHLAAALGKPILCFFGDSSAAQWRPWGVPYRLLQPASRDARDIGLEEALTAFEALAAQTGIAR